MEELFPESKSIDRVADKLVKVHTKSGLAQVTLFHIEFQGYYDKHFKERMFTYYYRLLDRYRLPISVLTIFTDKKAEIEDTTYRTSCLGTNLIFDFPVFYVNDYEPSYYDKFNNPIAEALKVAWYFQDQFKRNFKTDDLLNEMKFRLCRELLNKGYDKELIRHLISFIKHYVNFKKEEYYTIFDQKIETFTKPQHPMGLLEVVREAELNFREQKGIEKGREEGREEEITKVVRNMLKANLTIDIIANLAEVELGFVLKVKNEMQEAKKL